MKSLSLCSDCWSWLQRGAIPDGFPSKKRVCGDCGWTLIVSIGWSNMEEWEDAIRSSYFIKRYFASWGMMARLERRGNQRRDLPPSTWVRERKAKSTPKLSNLRRLSHQILTSNLDFMSEWVRWNVLRIIKPVGAEEERQPLRTHSWQPRWRIWHPAWRRRCSPCIRSGPLGFAWCL